MTTLTKAQIQAQAQRHHQAEQQRQQIKPVTITHPNMTMADAYAIQSAWKAIKLKEGRTIIGHKIGLTSKVMQRTMNISESDFGFLLDDMVFGDGSTINTSDFLDPRIEVELAFILKKDLSGPNVTLFDVLNATDYVVPALELIAARSFRLDPETGYKRTVKDTISDNAANGGIIMGGRPMRPDAIDLRWVSALLYKNGVIEESGVAAAVLNHPANGIAWLAKKYANFGLSLKAGEVILAGSFTSAIKVKSGDTIHADFKEMGSITLFTHSSTHFL